MRYSLVREDGLLLGRRPSGRWYYTAQPSAACRMPPLQALTALHEVIPAGERALWSLRAAPAAEPRQEVPSDR